MDSGRCRRSRSRRHRNVAVAGVGREHTPLSGDGSERIPVKSGTVGNTRVTHPHLNAFDTAGDTQTDRAHDIPLPQAGAGALHEPPDAPAGGEPTYHPVTAVDAHVPCAHTSSADDAALRDHDATDVDRLGPPAQPVDIHASLSKQWAGHHLVVHVPYRCRRRTTHGPVQHRRRPRMLPGLVRSARPQARTPRGPDRYRQRGQLLVPDLVRCLSRRGHCWRRLPRRRQRQVRAAPRDPSGRTFSVSVAQMKVRQQHARSF